jgi:GT2 family glycosyltransferase
MNYHLKLSIVIPTCRREHAVNRLIQSLRDQKTNDGFEVIVVNDSEEPIRLAAAERADGPREWLQIVHLGKNHGVCYARNVGVERAKGNIIGFLDDDVLAHDTWVSEVITTLDELPSLSAMVGRLFSNTSNSLERLRELVYENRHTINLRHRLPGSPETLPLGDVHYLSGGNCAVRTSVFRAVGGFDLRFKRSQDRELALRVIRHGGKVAYNPRLCVIHDNSMTQVSGLFKGRFASGRFAALMRREHESRFERSNALSASFKKDYGKSLFEMSRQEKIPVVLLALASSLFFRAGFSWGALLECGARSEPIS